MTESREPRNQGEISVKRLIGIGMKACYCVSVLSVFHAAFAYPDLLALASWLAASAYFFTAPAILRKGVEHRRIMVGILAVLLALYSFVGFPALVSGSNRIYGMVSVAMFASASVLIYVFGYSQTVASYLRKLQSEHHGSD